MMHNKAERLAAFERVDLYPVTCEQLSEARSDEEVLRGVIAGGARIVQLRDKVSSKRVLFAKAVRFRELTTAAGMLLIINDHADIAMAVGADGVHLGQDDLPLAAARELLPDRIIGISTHNLEEALAAQAGGADYVNVGPIFPTGTKDGVGASLGPDAIRRIRPYLEIPYTTMGGIHFGNLDQVLEAGARRIAVVSAITKAPDIALAVRKLRDRIAGFGNLPPAVAHDLPAVSENGKQAL